jgi:hypothetical protein
MPTSHAAVKTAREFLDTERKKNGLQGDIMMCQIYKTWTKGNTSCQWDTAWRYSKRCFCIWDHWSWSCGSCFPERGEEGLHNIVYLCSKQSHMPETCYFLKYKGHL